MSISLKKRRMQRSLIDGTMLFSLADAQITKYIAGPLARSVSHWSGALGAYTVDKGV